MTKRPISIIVIGCIFIAAGVMGLASHAHEFNLRSGEYLWASFIRLLAIVGGVFLLRGQNWARWLLAGWLAYHVVLSLRHSALEVAIHAILFAVIAYFLFRKQSAAYFRSASTRLFS